MKLKEATTGNIAGWTVWILIVAAKLFGFINWSWLWITSPIWIGLIFSLVFVGITYILGYKK